MAYDVNNVSAAKPVIGGAINVADVGTSLPTNATSSLTSFTNLGYVGEDGLINSNSASTTAHKAWGGDIVLTTQDEKTDTFQFNLIEVTNEDVLAFVYGDDNVSGTLATGIAVAANSQEGPTRSLVIDMIMRNGTLHRLVIPNGQITEMDDITYVDSDLAGFNVTVTAYPDSTGNTHYSYFEEAPSA